MRRGTLTIIIYASTLALLLTGCDGQLFSSRRDMERLRPVQVVGFDGDSGAVRVSVSAGRGAETDPPLVMQAESSGIEAAVSRLQDYSPEDELTYAHARYLLLGGETTGERVLTLLDWVERSPAMRMDTPLFIVKGSAAELVTGGGEGSSDITDRLASLEREEASRGQHIYTLREVAAGLLERDGALCLAVQALPSEGTIYPETERSDAVAPAGYAVLRGGAVAAYLTQSETYGAALLTTGLAGSRVDVAGNTLELISGRADASVDWDPDGTPAGISIECVLSAGLLERGTDGEPDPAVTEALLAGQARAWLVEAVQRSQALGCDFLSLRDAAAASAPGRAALATWDERYSILPVTVSVEARLVRSYDLAG